MARGVNKVILVGRLGQDPETRYTQAGAAITNISMATSESWKDKQTGQQQERTEWHRIVFFNKLAEITGEYLRKGSEVYIEGSLRTRKWQDNSGQDRYTTEIVASDMQMLGGRQDGQAPHQQQQSAQQQPPQQRQGGFQPQPQQQAPQGQQQQAQGGYDNFDDDIPFANPYKGIELVV